MVANDTSIAKIDAYRLKNVGEMLFTGKVESEYGDDPEQVLLDVKALDGKSLLAQYKALQAVYSTAPFDPQGKRFRMFPGGVTIWSGFPGMGKTTLLRQLICKLLQDGDGVFLASLEEHPQTALVRLACTAAGTEEPTEHQMQWFIDAFGSRLRVWGTIGIAKHRLIMAVIRKLAERGIKHAVIDSLMCLDVKNDDTEAQRCFVNLLANTARIANIHIHLVAHPRKPSMSGQDPDLNDVAGAREIGGLADNVLFVQRKDAPDPLSPHTGVNIHIKKQRHGNGSLGQIEGTFFRAQRQFHAVKMDQWGGVPKPVHYLPEDAYT